MKKQLCTLFIAALIALLTHNAFGSNNDNFLKQLFTPRPQKHDACIKITKKQSST